MEKTRGARSAGGGARGSQVRRPLQREPSPSGSEPDTEPQRTGGPGAEELDGLQSNRLNTSASPRDERPESLRGGGDVDLNIMEKTRGARSAGGGARGSQVRRPLQREPSPSGSEPDTEPQRTGGPGAEELDGLQSNRMNTSASPRDERPESLREGGDVDLGPARGRTTRGVTRRDYLSLSGSTRRTRKRNEVRPPYKLSTQTPGPTAGPSSGVVGARKRSRSLDENTRDKPDQESSSELSIEEEELSIDEGDVIDVCGVSPRELDTESVPMETFRQHKVGIIVGMRQNVKFIVSPFQ